MKHPFEQTGTDVLAHLKSSAKGLTEEEAARRRSVDGPNRLPEPPPVRWWNIALRQGNSAFVFLLLLALAVSLMVGERLDALLIGAALVINGSLGFLQEWKASRAFEQLRKYLQPFAHVRREGEAMRVAADDVVAGDILLLRIGDHVAADARLLSHRDLSTNESALTGESLPVRKSVDALAAATPVADRKNMVFAGTTVSTGRGEAVVTAIGDKTQLGDIARLVAGTKDAPTPLARQLKRLSFFIVSIVLVLIVVVFLLGLSRGEPWELLLFLSLSLAVAAVPEGLAMSLTVILAVGMQRILRRGSLVRNLLSAETLGSVDILLLDKTGTITTGIMSLTHAGDLDSVQRLGTKRSAAPSKAFWDALVLCNDAELPSARAAEAGVKLGSSTEMALLRGADQAGISIKARRSRFSRIAEIPFDSHRKFMAVRVREEGGGRREGGEDIFYVKGAPEVLLPLLGSIDRNRREESLAKEEKETLTARAAEMADQGLRVLLLARRRVPSSDGLVTSSIRDLVFLGFVGLSDPLRKGIRERVLEARAAGVRSIIVTGDHPQTARAIAEEAGILSSKEDVVLLGSTLDKETDVEIRSSLEHVSVIARVEPHHKQKIVDLFQRSGRVVAMTGDGVNDAPALKAADIGIALGSGTAVAKETSDLVLLDNDFSTIIAAIEEGRLLFDNIRKTVTYLLFDTFTLIILMLGAFLLGLPLPLLPLQILWINLVTDSLPSMALAFEPREDDLLGRPPRRRNEPILNRTLLLYLFIVGIATDFILLVGYRALLGSGVMEGEARSVIFAGAAAGSLLTAYAIRALRKPFWRVRLGQNWWLTGAVWAGLIPIMAMLTIPGWGSWLGITVLPAFLLPIALAFSLVKPVCLELAKALVRSRKNDSV